MLSSRPSTSASHGSAVFGGIAVADATAASKLPRSVKSKCLAVLPSQTIGELQVESRSRVSHLAMTQSPSRACGPIAKRWNMLCGYHILRLVALPPQAPVSEERVL